MATLKAHGSIDVAPQKRSTVFGRLSQMPLYIKVVIAWLIFIFVALLTDDFPLLGDHWLPDNDDLMRLVQVRDLLAGQNWFDMTQYRLDPPAGGFIHWSRIADLGIAAPMFLLRQVMNAELADALAMVIYPALLLLAFLFVAIRIMRQLAGDQILLPALLGILTCWSVVQQMTPGRIDHHGLQILLMFIALAQLLKAETLRSGLIMGLSMALSLGIGLETLAYIAVLQLGLWMLWSQQQAQKFFVRGVGLGMIAGCALVMVGTIAPQFWLAPVNDAFGRAHAALMLLGGMVWVLLSLFAGGNSGQRWLTGGIMGLVTASVIVTAFPEVIAAPYANLDPLLKTWMLANITETKPIWKFVTTSPMQATLYGLFLLSGLVSAFYLTIIAQTSVARNHWRVITCLLMVAGLIAMLQMRGFSFAHAMALIACTAMITHIRAQYPHRPGFLIATWLLCTMPGLGAMYYSVDYGLRHSRTYSSTEQAVNANDCDKRQTMLALQQFPKAVILAPFDMGVPVLAYTHHSVLAAPYHRVQRGLKDTIMAYRAPADQARSILAARHVDYVLYCKMTAETEVFQRNAPNSFMADLDHGKVPTWLRHVPLPAGNPLRVYRVTGETRQ
jgi:hypothetical protein